jgi:hypothetical protein
MQIRPEEFVHQDRGPRLFDRWQWKERVPTVLGNLIVELTSDDGAPPDVALADAAAEVAQFATANGDLLLDLIYGHYLYAQENDWLNFWGVPQGLSRNRILSQVESVKLTVRRSDDGQIHAVIYINPMWEQEHKLFLSVRDRRIVAVNDHPFVLDGGVLRGGA